MGLVVSGLQVSINRALVLRGVCIQVPNGKMVGLVGRNGAGKTTLMRSIMGLLNPDKGQITFDGENLLAKPPFYRAQGGIGYMPEDRRLIGNLTVEENIMMPAWATKMHDANTRLEWIYELIPEVAQYRRRRAMQFSGGQQKLIALGRALFVGRRAVLLDEPFEGVAPVLAERLVELIGRLRGEGLSTLVSESDCIYTSKLVDYVYRIERGEVFGPGSEAGSSINLGPDLV